MALDWLRKEFFLKNWIILVNLSIFFIALCCYMLDFLMVHDFDKINEFIIKEFLLNREGILISIAAIFIGIYFSIFTLLLTVKSSSKIVRMGIGTYKELVEFLKNAFLGSFVYILYAITFPLFMNIIETGVLKFLFDLILGILFTYMILTALRIGICFVYIFKADLKNLYENIDKETLEIEEQREIIHKLKSFLEHYEYEENKKKAEFINSKTKFNNPKK